MKNSLIANENLVELDRAEARSVNGGVIIALILAAANTASVGAVFAGLGGAMMASWEAGVDQGCG